MRAKTKIIKGTNSMCVLMFMYAFKINLQCNMTVNELKLCAHVMEKVMLWKTKHFFPLARPSLCDITQPTSRLSHLAMNEWLMGGQTNDWKIEAYSGSQIANIHLFIVWIQISVVRAQCTQRKVLIPADFVRLKGVAQDVQIRANWKYFGNVKIWMEFFVKMTKLYNSK